MRSLGVTPLVSIALLFAATASRADTIRLDLVDIGDGLVLRDTETGLEWLNFRATWDWAAAGITPNLDTYLFEGSPWRYASTAEICAHLSRLGSAPVPCPGDDAEGLTVEAVSAAAGELGFTFATFVAPYAAAAIGVYPNAPDEWGVVEVSRLDQGGALVPSVVVEEDREPSIPAFGHVLVRQAAPWPVLPASDRQPAALGPDEPFFQGSFPYRTRDAYGEVVEQGTTFRVWAPNAHAVAVLDMDVLGEEAIGGEIGFTAFLSCQDTGTVSWCPSGDCPCESGIWSGDSPQAFVASRYKYALFPPPGGRASVKRDPRGRLSDGPFHPDLASVVLDPFETLNPEPHVWTDRRYIRPRQREVVLAHARPAFLAESAEFDAAAVELEQLRRLGFNAIQLTPLMEYPTFDAPLRNTLDPIWYNSYFVSDLFAIEKSLGGASGYKRFVNAAHALGLAVHHEVKFNLWFDPSGHVLEKFDGWSSPDYPEGIYFWDTENGVMGNYGNRRPNFGQREVRDYMTDVVRQWLDDFHVDGFRFDQAGLAFYSNVNGPGLLPDGQVAKDWHRAIHAEMPPRVVSIAENLTVEDLGPDGAGFEARWWVGSLSAPPTFAFPLHAATVSNRFAPEPYKDFRQATYFPELYPGTPIIVRIAESVKEDGTTVCPTPLPEPFVACAAARRRFALLVALHLSAPGLPIIDVSSLFLRGTRSRPAGLDPADWSALEPGIWQLFREMIHMRRDVRDLPADPALGLGAGEDVPGVTGGLIGSHYAPQSVGTSGEVIAWHRWHVGGPGDDVVVLANLGGSVRSESFPFPSAGTWKVRLRTDEARFGYIDPEDEVLFPEEVTVGGPAPAASFTLQPYTAVILSQDCSDGDGDGICDSKDNCVEVATRYVADADGDGYGNACDADLDNDGVVGGGDLVVFSQLFGSSDVLADFNGDGVVGIPDFLLFARWFGSPPGPSGLSCVEEPDEAGGRSNAGGSRRAPRS